VGASQCVIGREAELETISKAITGAIAGHGNAIFLVGESGIGKTRLSAAAAELGYAAGARLLRGRASAVGPTMPFRPLTEALLSLLRSGVDLDVTVLGPYYPVLARLVPDWSQAAPVDDSLVVLAEAVLRLTALAGRDHGSLVVLDDLQDADAETLAIVDYLIDNVEGQPTLLLCTVRDEPCPALDLARAAGRRAGTLVQLGRLDLPDTRRLAGTHLGVEAAAVPRRVAELLWAGSAGNPLRVGELVAGMVDDGFLVETETGWTMAEPAPSGPPTTFTRSVARRFSRLEPAARHVLSVAAVLGRRFPLPVVRAVTGVDYRDLLSHLHGETAAQLVAVDDQTPNWYAFRHGLIREALVDLLDTDERAAIATRAADAIEVAYPGLPDEWCQTTAALRLAAKQTVAAGRLFIEAGRRALAQGAAHSGVTLLDQAWELLAEDLPDRVDALETQVHALVEAGLVERALAAGDRLASLSPAVDARRRARIHTQLAWGANVDNRTAEGHRQLEAARALLGKDARPEDTVPIDVVTAYLHLDTPGADLAATEAMARRAATAAEEIPLPVVACQAWQLLAALSRTRDPDEATAYLERSRTIAVRHDLPVWETHALVRLGMENALRTGNIDRIEQSRLQASRIGAVTARYQAEVNLALQLVLRGEFGEARELIDQVLTATTRLKLVEITQLMHVLRAVLAGHQGKRAEMVSAVDSLQEWRGVSTQHAPRIHGLAGAFCALLEEDRLLATEELAAALRADEANPTMFSLTGKLGVDLLLSALAGTLDRARLTAITSSPASKLRWDKVFASFAHAVLAGRDGAGADAERAVHDALVAAELYPMARHLGLRLVAEAALVDGWGAPLEWLVAAERYFCDVGVEAVADACRELRRGAAPAMPSRFRSAGITVREYEILLLLGRRLRNREIAEHLHVSQRTVETHVSSLLAKTGLPNRIALSKFATED
jgi:DNA-binding CsgD family transcriptional regulator